MPHFFVPPKSVQGGKFVLASEEARHLATVLRKKPGDEVRLFDGLGHVYRGVIETVTAGRVDGKVMASGAAETLPFALRLFQGLPRMEKFEWILEKVTELGVHEVIPVYTERGIVHVPPDKVAARVARWEKITLSAAKQSGQARLPKVSPPMHFAAALNDCAKDSLTIIPWEAESARSLKQVLRASPPSQGDRSHAALPLARSGLGVANVFIGPEGGFTPAEVALAQKHGAVSVTLGPSILRTETAGLFVASALIYEWALDVRGPASSKLS